MRVLKGRGLPDLKPCPFCGQPAKIGAKDAETVNRYNAPQEVTGTRSFYFVGCFDGPCEIHPRSFAYDKSRAVELWNRRATPEGESSEDSPLPLSCGRKGGGG